MIGRTINNYEIKAVLGQGGMGSVYLAEHPVLGRRAAIKVLKREYAENPTQVSRFVNEARAATAVRHPGIVEVYDVGTLPDGLPYLMMELLEGETLAERLRRQGRLDVADAIDVTVQAGGALAAAHDRGIVHRDLKPDNLFLVPDPTGRGRPRVKVLDFGIAKLQTAFSGAQVRTHTGAVVGTPLYMSPEQCRGISSEIDRRTDVYALGVILYEMLTGAPPFVSEGLGDILIMHLGQAPRPPHEIDAGIPDWVEAVVLRALEKDREARFGSAGEMVKALVGTAARTTVREAGSGPPVVQPAAPQPPAPATTGDLSAVLDAVLEHPRRGRRRLLIGAGLAAGLGAAGLAWTARRRSDALAPTPPTQTAVVHVPPPPAPPQAAAVVVPPPVAEPPPAPVPSPTPRPSGARRGEKARPRVPLPAAAAPPVPPPPAPVAPAPIPAPVPPPAPAPTPRIRAEKW